MNFAENGFQLFQSLLVVTIGAILTFSFRYIGSVMKKKEERLEAKLQENLNKIVEIKQSIDVKITDSSVSLNDKFDFNFKMFADKLEDIVKRTTRINDKVTKYEENIRELYEDIREVKLKIQQLDTSQQRNTQDISSVLIAIEKVKSTRA